MINGLLTDFLHGKFKRSLDIEPCGLYYNRVTIVATIVTQISKVVSRYVQKFKNDQNDPAYLG